MMDPLKVIASLLGAGFLIKLGVMMFHQYRYYFGVMTPAYRDWAAQQPFQILKKSVKWNPYLNPPGLWEDFTIGQYDITYRILVQDAKGATTKGWLRLCEHDQRRSCSILVGWDDTGPPLC